MEKRNEQMTAQQFLRAHGMHPDDILFEKCVLESENDMRAGLSGNRVSFEMLPCYLSMKRLGDLKKKNILVLDAGGTNLRLAMVRCKDTDELEVDIKEKQRMPGVEKPVDVNDVFDVLADKALPYLPYAEGIGFCFSYAMDVQENRDGRIRFICKSIQIDHAEGRLVGEGLNRAIAGRGAQSKDITVVNDAIAVTLAAGTGKEKFGGYIGMIIGTGFNIGYIEDVNCIGGINKQRYSDPDMLINMESDRFFKMKRGTFDLQYDSCAGDAEHPTMKMLTGAYLGGLCYLTFLGAAAEGLLSAETAGALKKLGTLQTEELCAFLDDPGGNSVLSSCCATESDAALLCRIALLLIERASKLVAAILLAVIRRSYRYCPDKPICICVEGSTVEKVPTMKHKICEYLSAHIDAETEAFEMIMVENATIRGAAIAALQYN